MNYTGNQNIHIGEMMMPQKYFRLIGLTIIVFCINCGFLLPIAILSSPVSASDNALPLSSKNTLTDTVVLTTKTPLLTGQTGESVTYTVKLKNVGTVSNSYKVRILWKNPKYRSGFADNLKTDSHTYSDLESQEEISFPVSDYIFTNAAEGDTSTIIVEATGEDGSQARLQLTTVVSTPNAIEFVTRYGLAPRDAFVQDTYAYVYDATKLSVVDISNPISPTEIGSYNLPPDSLGAIQSVVVQDDYAYLATGLTGLQILDISNPLTPTRVGVYERPIEVPGQAEEVEVSGNYAYVVWNICYHPDPAAPRYASCKKSELRILDISNPITPTLIGIFDQLKYVSDVKAQDDLVFLAADLEGLHLVDVSNPFGPVEIGVYDEFVSPAFWALCRNIAVQDNYVYIATGSAGLRILDVSDPKNPLEVDSPISSTHIYDVDVSNNYAYLGSRSDDGLRIVDISNPALPIEAGYYKSNPAKSIFNLTVVDDHVYIPDYAKGLQIIDVSSPITPVEISSYSPPSVIQDMLVLDNYAYIADKSYGLRIMDTSTPTAPIEIGSYATQDEILNVIVAGDYAYIVTKNGASLSVIDVSNPSMPIEVGTYELPAVNGLYAGQSIIKIVGYYLYLVNADGKLYTFDISIPNKPKPVSLYDNYEGEIIKDIDLDGNSLFILQSGHNYAEFKDNTTLDVVDVSNPSEPIKTGTYTMPYFSYSVSVIGNYAYLPYATAWASTHGMHYPYSYALYQIDISDLSNPIGLGNIEGIGITENLKDITISDNYGYIAAGSNGLRVVDISRPENPIEITSYALPGNAVKVAMISDYIYAASDVSGIFILRH